MRGAEAYEAGKGRGGGGGGSSASDGLVEGPLFSVPAVYFELLVDRSTSRSLQDALGEPQSAANECSRHVSSDLE